MVKVKWTYQAIEDIEGIAEFIAKDSEKYAAIQVQRFFDKASILSELINPSALANPKKRAALMDSPFKSKIL